MATPNSMIDHRRNRQRGAALIELALVLPLLIVLSVLVSEFGRAFFQYHTLTKGVRDAVRFLAVQDPAVASTDPDVIATARNLLVYGQPRPGPNATPVVPGLNLDQVPASNIAWTWSTSSPSYRIVSVHITGHAFRPLWSSLFGLSLANAQGEIPFGTIAASMRAPE